jgi:acyl-CoA synthetase (AMP-forming)/AMP-acid ligase II
MDWSKLQIWGDVVRRNAAAAGGKPAFISAGASVTFAEVNARVNRLNNALAGLGLAHGDRVAILSRNRPEFFEVYGVAKSGLVAVPLNWRLSARELLHPLRDSSPVVIVAEPNFTAVIDALRPELAGIRHFIVLDEAKEGWSSYEGLLAGASMEEPRAGAAPDDALCLTYSSGTTGTPKGAIITHRSAMNNCRAVVEDLLKLTQDDVGLAVMPLFHVGGMCYDLAVGIRPARGLGRNPAARRNTSPPGSHHDRFAARPAGRSRHGPGPIANAVLRRLVDPARHAQARLRCVRPLRIRSVIRFDRGRQRHRVAARGPCRGNE